MRKIALLLPFLTLCSLCIGQSRIKDGDRHYEHARYEQALQAYKNVKEEKSSVPERVRIRIGACYRQLKRYEEALEAYKELHEKGLLQSQQLLNYGHLLRNHMKYEKAKKIYQEFADNKADDPRGYYYKEASNWAADNLNKNPAYQVQELDLASGKISLGQDPFEGGLLFSSPKKVKTEWGELKTYDMVYAKGKNGSFSEHQKLKGGVNNHAHQGNPSVRRTEDGPVLYYSSNASEKLEEVNVRKKEKYDIGKDLVNHLSIKVAERTNGEWEEKEGPDFNDGLYDVAQPFVTPNGDSLFFASNMEGGKGGYDIFLSTKTDSGWKEPEALGEPVNSMEDEMFPFWRNNTLYFASYGHFNFGGSDIFKCKYHKEKGEWGSVENMGRPINSPKDDFAYTLTSDPDSGFFSSNRNSDPGKDRFFSFKHVQLPDTIRGIARNRINSQPIDGVQVTLFHDGETVSQQTTNETGKCKLVLEPKTEYKVRFKKEGYEKKEHKIPKKDREDVIALLNSIELDPKPTKDKVIELSNIYFDYGEAELRPDGKKTLDKLYGYMKDHPEARIELGAHTDAQSSAEFNMNLSNERASSCFGYLKKKGLSVDRMEKEGYGETQLVNECSDGVECPDEKHQENRRVEITFLNKKSSS